MIYIGIRDTRKEFVLKINKNRHQFNNIFDKWIDQAFIDVFGIAARNQCCFCTQNIQIAKNYGIPYKITPIGNFEVFYSNEITDLHDLSWVKSQIYSDKEFTEELCAAFAIRVWTSEKSENQELKHLISGFLELPFSKVLKYALSLKNAGTEFVSTFYKRSDDFLNIRKNSEIMLVCDSVKCVKS